MSDQATDNQDNRPCRAMSPQEMADAEREAFLNLRGWLESFRHFPTSENLRGAIERLEKYQTAWMNGRKRTITIE